MKFVAIAAAAILMFTAVGVAQNQNNNTAGAKRLFYDTTTGVRTGGGPEPRPAPRGGGQPGAGGGSTQPAPAPPKPGEVTGLMYYVEVIQPTGQALRVNTSRVFHSGERLRFHIMSNVSGKLTILQSENDGPLLPLFPNPQLRGGDDRVEQGKETIIPMVFDNRPGNIRLLMMLVADGAAQPVRTQASTTTANPPPSTTTQTATPAPTPRPSPQQTAPVTQQASNSVPPSAKPRGPITEEEIRARLRQQTGSKALRIEVDESPSEAATYVVVDSRQQPSAPAGTVAVEVRFNHQP